MAATRRDPGYWLENMLVHHRYTWDEAAARFGWSAEEVQQKAAELDINRGRAAGETSGRPGSRVAVSGRTRSAAGLYGWEH